MDATANQPADRQFIEAYGNGGFKVSGITWSGPVLVLPDLTRAWTVVAVREMTAESLAPVMEADPAVDLLLVGCGVQLVSPDARLTRQLRTAGIVIEPMDTGAACRTYNVLVAEERRVAAALIPVD